MPLRNRSLFQDPSIILLLAIAIFLSCGSGSKGEKGKIDNKTGEMPMSDSFQARSGYADINGAKIYYEIQGRGRPFVMLHAGVADSRMWESQAEYFSRYYKVITFDFRGFGRTDMPEGPYANYLDLAVLLDTLGIESAILMGCSMGGSTAIDFALEYPDRVLGLALIGSAIDGYRVEDKQVVENWIETDKAAKKKKYEKAAELDIEQWIIGPARAPAKLDESIIEFAREMIMAHYRHYPLRGEEQGPDQLAIDRLTQITVPTLIVVGSLDAQPIFDMADLLEKDIANSRKVIIPETAHLPNIEKPEAFNILVHDFQREAGL